MYKLTIAHGTYENSEKFKATLESILPQLKLFSNVQLLILDDSVTNKTENIIKKNNLKNIKYVRGRKRSIDYAFIWLMANSNSEYVWWFGDDVMENNSIGYVLKELEKNPDFIFINSIADKKTLDYGKNFRMSGPEVIEKIGDLLLFLSSLLWRKEIIYPYLYKYEHKFYTAIGFAYPQMEVFSKKGFFLYIDKPLFKSEVNRSFDQLFYDPFKVFGIYYFELLDTFGQNLYLKNSIKKEKKRRGYQILKGVLYYKIKGLNYGLGKTTFTDLFRTYWNWYIFWISIPAIIIIYLYFFLIKKA